MGNELDRFCTVSEAVDRLSERWQTRVATRTVQSYIARGILTGERVGNRTWLILLSQVMTLDKPKPGRPKKVKTRKKRVYKRNQAPPAVIEDGEVPFSGPKTAPNHLIAPGGKIKRVKKVPKAEGVLWWQKPD